MINQELLTYIKNQIKLGRSEDIIKSILINNGWQTNEIEEAFNDISSNNNQSASSVYDNQSINSQQQRVFEKNVQKGGSKKIILTLIVLLLVAGAFSYFYFKFYLAR